MREEMEQRRAASEAELTKLKRQGWRVVTMTSDGGWVLERPKRHITKAEGQCRKS